jgi:hypothetical protein
MQPLTLTCHHSTPCPVIRQFAVCVSRAAHGELSLVYRVEGETARLRLPESRPPRRADELWRHTCFEAFIKAGKDAGYHELNFAPSGDWACYRFDAYRDGMADAPVVHAPRLDLRQEARQLILEARLNLNDLSASLGDADLRLGLSAVMEAEDGDISFWALAHPPGRPDFHHAAGFALALPLPDPAQTPPTRKQQ